MTDRQRMILGLVADELRSHLRLPLRALVVLNVLRGEGVMYRVKLTGLSDDFRYEPRGQSIMVGECYFQYPTELQDGSPYWLSADGYGNSMTSEDMPRWAGDSGPQE